MKKKVIGLVTVLAAIGIGISLIPKKPVEVKAITSFAYSEPIRNQIKKTSALLHESYTDGVCHIDDWLSCSSSTEPFTLPEAYLLAYEAAGFDENLIDFTNSPFYEDWGLILYEAKSAFYVMSLTSFCLINGYVETTAPMDFFRLMLDHSYALKDPLFDLSDCYCNITLDSSTIESDAKTAIKAVSNIYNSLFRYDESDGWDIEDCLPEGYSGEDLYDDVREFLYNKSNQITNFGDPLIMPLEKIGKILHGASYIIGRDTFSPGFFDDCLIEYCLDFNHQTLLCNDYMTLTVDDLDSLGYDELSQEARDELREKHYPEIVKTLINMLISFESLNYFCSDNYEYYPIVANNIGPFLYKIYDVMESFSFEDYPYDQGIYGDLLNTIILVNEALDDANLFITDQFIENGVPVETYFRLYNDMVVGEVKSAEIERLNGEVDSLTADCEELSATIAGLNTTISTLNGTINTLNSTIETKTATISILEGTIAGLEDELRDTISSYEVAIGSLNNQISLLEEQITLKNSEITSLTNQNSSLNSEISSKNLEIERLNGEIDNLKDSMLEMESRMNDVVSDYESKISVLNEEITSLELNVFELNNSLTLKNEEVETLQDSVLELQGRLENAIANYENTIGELTSQVDLLELQVDGLERTLLLYETDIENLNEQIDTLEEDNNSLKSQLESKKNEVTKLTNQITSLNGDINVKNDKIEKLNKDIKALEDEIEENETSISSLNESVSELSSKVDSLKSQLEEKKARINQLENSVTELNNQINVKNETISQNEEIINEFNTSFLWLIIAVCALALSTITFAVLFIIKVLKSSRKKGSKN